MPSLMEHYRELFKGFLEQRQVGKEPLLEEEAALLGQLDHIWQALSSEEQDVLDQELS